MSRVALVDVGRSKMLRCTIMFEDREDFPWSHAVAPM